MSDRNRVLIAAAAIGLTIAAIIWGVLGIGLMTSSPDRAAANGYVRAERGDQYYESYNATAALTHEACSEASQGEGAVTNERELCAQFIAATAARKAANLAEIQTWIGLAGFAFVFVGLALNWQATIAATEQAQIARRALPQPFLQVEPKDFKFAKPGERRGLLRGFPKSDSASFVLHNHGPAPGVLIQVQARLDIVADDDPWPGWVRDDPIEPNILVFGTVVGADKDSEVLWANRTRTESEEHFDGMEDWWLHGYAVYSDGKDRNDGKVRYYAIGFCFKFTGFGWARSTPNGYRNGDANYHREIGLKDHV